MSQSSYLRKGLVVVIGVAVRALIAFAFTKTAAVWLGPARFGAYGHYLILASYLVTASSLGLSNAYTVYIAQSPGRAEPCGQEQSLAVVLVGAGSGLLFGVLIAALLGTGSLGWLLPRVSGGQVFMWLLLCVFSGGGSAFLASLLGRERHLAYQVLSSSIPAVSFLALAGTAILGEMSPERAIDCYMLGFFAPLLVFLARRPPLRSTSAQAIRAVLHFARPFVMPSLLIPTIGSLGLLVVRGIVASNASAYDVGLWQALWRLGESYMGVLLSIATAVYVPRLARVDSAAQARREVRQASTAVLLLYLPVAFFWLFAPQVALRALLSQDFSGIQLLLPIQVVGDVLKLLCAIQVLSLTSLLRPGLTLVAELIFNSLFVAGTALLSPAYGGLGAVAAYAAAYALLLVVLLPLTRRRITELAGA